MKDPHLNIKFKIFGTIVVFGKLNTRRTVVIIRPNGVKSSRKIRTHKPY